METDIVLTLDSDSEDASLIVTTKKKKLTNEPAAKAADDEATLNPDFAFDLNGNVGDGAETDDADEGSVAGSSKPACHFFPSVSPHSAHAVETQRRITVDDIIKRRKDRMEHSRKRKRFVDDDGRLSLEESDADGPSDNPAEDSEEEGSLALGDDISEGSFVGSDGEGDDISAPSSRSQSPARSANSDDSDDSDEETFEQKEKKAAFFAPETPEDVDAEQAKTFMGLNLSRPILRAIQAINFTTPTPIQKKAIPIALQGLDVLGSAVTGSGKTAAFMIPILERLTYKDRNGGGETRVLILMPTRELAVQCAEVAKSLARFMDVTFAVVVGGLSLKVQESALRSRPDVIIATPGRLIDHIRNTQSFTLSSLDILVLDEADRMLQDGFADELAEIIASCPKSRQTMLFSATMTDDVDKLVKLSMNRPVRLFVDPKRTVAKALTQEFVRVRKETDRQAILATLCKRTARKATIIFFRSKVLCHQMKVAFGLLGLKAAELHGNLTQEQRLTALKQFRDHEVDYLLATDVASRGLDIKGVGTVINYDMPSQIELYLHRVGRTARATSKGRSISLVGEADRKMLKSVLKRSQEDQIKHRVLPSETLKAMGEKLEDLRDEVKGVLEEEQEEKAIRAGEMQATKIQNLVEHREEILARPKREWFQSKGEKAESQVMSKQQYTSNFNDPGPPSNSTKKKRMNNHQTRRKKEVLDRMHAEYQKTASSVRDAKKAARPSKITWAPPAKKAASSSLRPEKRRKVKHAGFDSEMGIRGGTAATREGARSKRGDNVPLKDKKGRGKSGKAKTAGKVRGKGKRK